jgi:hypothetical protein
LRAPGPAEIKPPLLVTKEPSVTSHGGTEKRAKMPAQKLGKKPPTVTGYHWRAHGAGWDLRKDVYVTSHDGERKRKQPYVAHLSREAFAEMKRRHRGAALEKAIADWIRDHDR